MPMPTSDMIAGSASTITYVSIAATSTDAAAMARIQRRRVFTRWRAAASLTRSRHSW